MTKSLFALGLLVLSEAATFEPSVLDVPPRAYTVMHGWPILPDGVVLGWVVSGVGVDSRGDVFVLHWADREWPSSDVLDTGSRWMLADASTSRIARMGGFRSSTPRVTILPNGRASGWFGLRRYAGGRVQKFVRSAR